MYIFSKNKKTVISTHFFFLLSCTMVLTGCATSPKPLAPPKGWVNFDPITSQGVYIQSDGTRLFSNRTISGELDGRTTMYYGDKNKNYDLGYWNKKMPDGYSGASVRRNMKDSKWIAGPITIVVPDTKYQDGAIDRIGFIFKGMADENGLIGPGKIIRSDGFYMKGLFDYQQMPILWLSYNGEPNLEYYKLLGSYAHGNVKAYWPNGDTFEGNIVNFFPFDRGSSGVYCSPSSFYGNGILKRPGKKDYIGFVYNYEWRAAVPTTKEKVSEYIEEFGDCPSEARAEHRKLQNRLNEYENEMAEGRRNANKMLSDYFAQLPNKIVNDMARVESASRGSSVEIDQEKSRKNAELNDFLLNETNRSEIPSKQADNATRPPNTAAPLNTVTKKVYQFTRSITYQSTYANLTKEKALETVNSERNKNEPIFMGGMVTNWRVIKVSEPVCTIRDDIREVGHWVCKMNVDYSGETTLNPESKPSTTSKVQSK